MTIKGTVHEVPTLRRASGEAEGPDSRFHGNDMRDVCARAADSTSGRTVGAERISDALCESRDSDYDCLAWHAACEARHAAMNT